VMMVKCLLFDMTSTIVKTLDELGLAGGSQLLEEINPVDRLLSCENVFQMKEEMFAMLEQICRYVESRKKSHNTGLKETVEAYVASNYADQNLSISWLADQLNMNASYLSRFYKEQSGESLVDCINRKRIAVAKLLLKDTGLNMNDIAEQVGFSSNIALIRSFKRYEGITPGKYKEIN
jgi:two-component system response regulator YesN